MPSGAEDERRQRKFNRVNNKIKEIAYHVLANKRLPFFLEILFSEGKGAI